MEHFKEKKNERQMVILTGRSGMELINKTIDNTLTKDLYKQSFKLLRKRASSEEVKAFETYIEVGEFALCEAILNKLRSKKKNKL